MKTTTMLSALSLALCASAVTPAFAADTPQPVAVAQPSAETILRQMSSALSGARQFSFKGTRQIEAASAGRAKLPGSGEFEVVVRRPDKLLAVDADNGGVRRMVFDGAEFTLYQSRHNTYASVAMRSSLDALPGELARVYGFVPPLADFVISDSYADIRRRTTKVSLLGREPAGTPAVESYRLALSGRLADAQLWVGVEDHLPRKLTAKVIAGPDAGASVTIEFLAWDLLAPVSESTFVFTPPKGALKIPMIKLADAPAKGAKK